MAAGPLPPDMAEMNRGPTPASPGGPQAPPGPPMPPLAGPGPSPQGGGPSAMGGPPKPPQPPEMPNVVTIDQVMQLMRDDRMRGFRIDIETDSTIQADENEYKQRLGEMVTGVGMFIEKVMPAAEAHPELAPFLGEMLLTVTRGYRVGRQMEGALEDAVVAIEDKAMAGGGGKIDPATAKAQADAAMKKMEIEAKIKERTMIEEAETLRSRERIAADKEKHEKELSAQNDPQAKQLEIQKMQAELYFKKEELNLKKEGQVMDLELKQKQHALQEQSTQKDLMMKDAEMAFKKDDQGLKQQGQQHTQNMDMERFGFEREQASQQAQMAAQQGEQKMMAEQGMAQQVGQQMQELMQALMGKFDELKAEIDQIKQVATAEKPDRSADAMMAIAAAMSKPKTIMRGPDGVATGVE
jgi:hypothetical protein